ncbi:heme NO-binding domain-containing protein [Mucilaginibacter gotjawali]|uniref:Uncharacterized protein n=2 Tax=Mucilaginibacter gotjawali TaxID=1550579 RepID=A0A839SIL3_9SPHI|nr:heme NO-binding domain-containing protein [Mucilaginibacter gotjawali]MBB3058161.1 hypothetical protein [Mucilaginibacter gotjawali]BAU54884.1 Heme NO binding protein [Mucilaginibacter gotjawali]
MYGIINKSIEELVIANFGDDKWKIIKEKSGIDVDFFISSEPYDDNITYLLASAVSREMAISIDAVFLAFGEWWVMKTSKEKYGSLMEAGGQNLKDFLLNLPVFHNRIMLVYPKLTPPEFKISNIAEKSLFVHYFSKRQGLKEFVRGLLYGLGKIYNTPVTVELINSREEGNSHEIFNVSW